jgi:poly(3-hydroxybutyrate) depolymerase
MTQPRRTVAFEVDGKAIAGLAAGPESAASRPLIAALHGGTYNARYFDVAGSDAGTFLDLAAAGGYPVAAPASPRSLPITRSTCTPGSWPTSSGRPRGGSARTACSWSATRSAA